MKRNKDCKRLLFVLNKNHNVTRFLSKVCRTGQNMIFTHQQSRPSQDVFIDNVSFSDMQRNRPQQVPFAVTFSEKEQTEKFPFQQQKTELHQLFEGLLSIFFFFSEFSDIPEKFSRRRNLAILKRFALQANAIRSL